MSDDEHQKSGWQPPWESRNESDGVPGWHAPGWRPPPSSEVQQPWGGEPGVEPAEPETDPKKGNSGDASSPDAASPAPVGEIASPDLAATSGTAEVSASQSGSAAQSTSLNSEPETGSTDQPKASVKPAWALPDDVDPYELFSGHPEITRGDRGRFVKGHSGNPNGPKVRKVDAATQDAKDETLIEVLMEPVKVNGRLMPTYKALLLLYREKGLQGDLAASRYLLDDFPKALERALRSNPDLYRYLKLQEADVRNNTGKRKKVMEQVANSLRKKTLKPFGGK